MSRWVRASARIAVVGVLGLGAAWALCMGARAWSWSLEPSYRLQAAEQASRRRAPGDSPLDVVINEVAWMGTAYSDWDEWIELCNNTGFEIDVTGWTLTSTGSLSVLLSGAIPARGYLLLERDDRAVADTPADQIYGGQRMGNAGETLVLRNAVGLQIDTANADRQHGSGWPAGSNNPERTMERLDPALPDTEANWATNDGTVRNGLDAGGNPISGTPGAPNGAAPSPGLWVLTVGPEKVTPGMSFGTEIHVGSSATQAITSVVVTDVLPIGLSLVSQSSPVPLSYQDTQMLAWNIGVLSPGVQHTIALVLRPADVMSGSVTSVVTATAGDGAAEQEQWSAHVIPHVRIHAAHPWALRSDDEALALRNLGTYTVALSGWGISDGDSVPDAVLPAVHLAPGGILWIADQGDAFRTSFGFAPDVAQSCVSCAVPILTGTWPGFANLGDQVILLHESGLEVDTLVYGNGEAPPQGWSGRGVDYPRVGFGSDGQILYRRLAEGLSRPVTDTDVAGDWANDGAPGNVLYGPIDEGDLYGKRVAYPGWNWDAYTRTYKVEGQVLLTVAVAPDNSYGALAWLLDSAQHSVSIATYSLESVWLTAILTERIAAGVQVTVLLEGGEVSDQELWNCQAIASAGGAVYFMHNDPGAGIYDRYVSQHAKAIVVDGARIAVSSENLSNRAFPTDDKANGTAGRRGAILIADQPDVARYVAALVAQDCDPARYQDIVSYGALPRYTVPLIFTPAFSTGGGGYDYMAPFSETASGYLAQHIEVIHSPETSLGYTDGLLGLLLRAGPGDEVYVQQMYERLGWGASGTDPNPRLEAYIQAARNGARVRVLLDNAFDDARRNYGTAFYLLEVARAEALDLDVRLGNPTLGGIHNKMMLVQLGGHKTVHVGSINGSEVSSKANRELALQVRSSGAYDYLKGVWEYDWAHSRSPHETYFPVVARQHVPESDHVLISEVMCKQAGSGEELGEWIELYNPTAQSVDVGGWKLGDAVRADDYERLYAFPPGTRIAAGGTLVIARRAASYQALGYPGKPMPDFEWTQSNAVPNMVATSYGDGECALGNAGDEVMLLDAQGWVVDALVYGAGRYRGVVSFGDIDSVYNGNSLERRPANRDSDDCGRDFRVRYTPAPGEADAW